MPESVRTKAELLESFSGTPRITSQDLRDLVETLSPSFGSYYVSGPMPTQGMEANTWVKAQGNTMPGTLMRFTHSLNRLTYVGDPPIHVHIAASVSFTTSGSGNIVSIGIAHNDAILPGEMLREVGEGDAVGSTAVHGDVMLSTNDFLEIWIKTNQVTASRAVTLEAAYMFALGMMV